jgi:hypothetical protein
MPIWDGPVPLYRKCPNILKTIEIPTSKPYIFLILVSGDIRWYVGHDHTGGSVPPETGSALIFRKLLRSPPINHTVMFLFLVLKNIWWYIVHDITWWFHPPETGSAQIFRKEIHTFKPFLVKMNPILLSAMLSLGDFIVTLIIYILFKMFF